MGHVLRISGRDSISMTLLGLAPEEIALLQKIFVMSDRPDRPAFTCTNEGEFSIYGSTTQLIHCARRLSAHPSLPDHIRSIFSTRLNSYLHTDYRISIRDKEIDLGKKTHIMGILNVTPDSFSDGGLYAEAKNAVARAREMETQGADIIDIGGESTRPGAEPLSEEEELRRIIPVIRAVAAETAVPISVDTYKASVARAALEAGASIVNDISGLRFSPDMARVAADHGAAVIVMHIKGTPKDMQINPRYDDVIAEITTYLEESIEIAIRAGIGRSQILIDPGIGFGKTVEHNLEILNRLDELRVLGCPIVLGTSRKRFIGAILDIPAPKDRIEGTAATVAIGIIRGARIVRVHDVAQMSRVVRMTDAILQASTTN